MQTDEQTIRAVEAAKQANSGLMKQGFKCQTVMDMMNNCADRCELVYQESGIEDASRPGVECYKNCITKAYKLATQSLQQ